MNKKSKYIKGRVTELSKEQAEKILSQLNVDMSTFLRHSLEILINKSPKIYFSRSVTKEPLKEVLTRVDGDFKKQVHSALNDSNVSAASFFQLIINALITAAEEVSNDLTNKTLSISISDFGLISIQLKDSPKEDSVMTIPNLPNLKNKKINKMLTQLTSLVNSVLSLNKTVSDWPLRISYANQKGGVGKTTYNVQLAILLGLLGYKVLFIDDDPQGNSSSFLLKNANHEELGTINGVRAADLFNIESLQVENIAKSDFDNIDIIYSMKNDADLTDKEAIPLELTAKQKQILEQVKDNYDFIFVDCVPSLGRLLLSALTVSQHIISPLELSGFAFDGVEGVLDTVLALQQTTNSDLNYVGGFINKLKTDSKIQIKIKNQVMKDYPELIIKKIIPIRSPLDTAMANKQSVLFEKYAYVTIIDFLTLMIEIFTKIKQSY